MARSGGMWQRILALLGKELSALWNDRKTRTVILIPPLIQVMIFANAAVYDVRNVPLGIWNDDAGSESAELVREFAGSTAFRVVAAIDSPRALAAAIDAEHVSAVLHLPQNFSADMLAGRTAAAQLVIDTRRSNTALMIESYAATIVAGFTRDRRGARAPPVALTVRDWFNPTLESKWFILPGLFGVLSMMMAMLVSALSLARERELGTFEQLLVTPLRPAEVLIGKALPGLIVGWIDANIVLVAAVLWFGVPFRGNIALLQAMVLLYMLAGVGIGLAISAITRTQQQAMLGVFVVASPLIVLSGFAAPVENMPAIVEVIGRADPVRWMMVIARGLFLQDMPLAVVLRNAWPLAVIAAACFAVAGLAVRRAVS